MIDCNKTADFLREWDRMCDSREECKGCPTSEPDTPCYNWITMHPQEAIENVQKWSDEHPRKSWSDELRERLPYADMAQVITCLCPSSLFGNDAPYEGTCGTVDRNCVECWLQEYKEGK